MSNASSKQANNQGSFAIKGQQVPWGPVAAIVITLLGFVCAQIIVGTVMIIALKALGVDKVSGNAWLDSTVGQFIFVLGSDSLILLIVWLFLRHRRAGFAQLGFGRRPLWQDLGFALLAYGAYFVLLIAATVTIGALTHIDLNQKQELGFDGIHGAGQIAMAFISLVLLPPIVEETLFRGFLYTGLRKKLKFVWATIITSLLFAGPHLLASNSGLLWVAGIDTLILSFILCYLREKTGALWAPMALHTIKNCLAYIILLHGIAAL